MSHKVEIRKAKSGDEHELIKMFRSLYQESDFLLKEPGESEISAEEQAQLVKEYSQSNSQVLFVAAEEKAILGFLGGTGGKTNRNRHTIHIAMGVLEAHQCKGIGHRLLQNFVDWAVSNQFHRIELTVVEANTRAKALYEKMGFQTEGIKHNSLKVNGAFINEYYMAKLI